MSYDPSSLTINDPTSIAWALAWVRRLTNDRAEPLTRTNEEIAGDLQGAAFHVLNGDDPTLTYYRPHATAATLIRSDPHAVTQESIDNAQATYRNPAAVAASILLDYAWMDDLIETATGSRPASGHSFRPVF